MGELFQLFLGRSGGLQDLGYHPLLGLLPCNCHGTSGCVILLADWGSRSSLVCHWSHVILIGLSCDLGSCHSFKSCALPLPLLFSSVQFTNSLWKYINREGTRTTHQQKIGLKIYWAWPRPSEQDPFSPSVSLSHQEASISLLSFSVRGQTEWKPQSQKSNQSDHMDHSLV